MKEFYFKKTIINHPKQLKEESYLQKRENAELRIQQFLAGNIEDCYKEVNWVIAKTNDYDYIPWAENILYEQLWKDRTNEAFTENDIALAYEFPIDTTIELPLPKQLDLFLDFFREKFYEDNILSFMIHNSEKMPHCHVLIYIDKEDSYSKSYINDTQMLYDEIKDYLYENGFRYRTIKKHDENGKEELPFLNAVDYYSPKNGNGYTQEDGLELIYDAKTLKSLSNPEMKIEKQEKILDRILEYFTTVDKRIVRDARQGRMEQEAFFKKVIDYIEDLGKDEITYRLSDVEKRIMVSRVDEAIFGYYVLDDLLNDDSISDIKVISPNKIRIKRYGKRLTSNLYFRNFADYIRFCEGVAMKNHTNLDMENAVQNFTDVITNKKNILRFNICTNYVNSVPYPYIHIRKVSRIKKGIEELFNAGMLDLKTAAYLLEKVKTSSGILFTGKGGSGKTTLMNTLLEFIPYTRSGLIIQENEELFSYNHPDLMFQHTVIPHHYGLRPVGLEELARNGLLTDLDYFIIGEIKGAEALPFLNAAYTGHQCWASVHGASSTQALNKLADYVKYASDYSREDALKMLMSLEVVIFMKDYKIYEISEIKDFDYERGEIIYDTIYQYKQQES